MSSPVECHRGAPDPNPEPSRSEAQQARTPSRWASQADSPFGFPRVATRSQVMVSTSMTDTPLAAGEAFMSPLGLSFRPSRSATCSSRLQARAQESAPRMCLQKSAGARGRTRVNEAGAGEARRSGLPQAARIRAPVLLDVYPTMRPGAQSPPCGFAGRRDCECDDPRCHYGCGTHSERNRNGHPLSKQSLYAAQNHRADDCGNGSPRGSYLPAVKDKNDSAGSASPIPPDVGVTWRGATSDQRGTASICPRSNVMKR